MGQQGASQTRTPEAKPRTNIATSRQSLSPAYDVGSTLSELHPTIGNRAVGRVLQAKLQVSEPGDMYEREADAVAELVMRLPRPTLLFTLTGPVLIFKESALNVPRKKKKPCSPRRCLGESLC
jgi:hypothetical protein